MAKKCGIVGLPNVGKSTLFNILTKLLIPAENYPFCTIEPNTGIVEVIDQRIEKIADIVHPEKIQRATVEFVDIAGLVSGASCGEGLGNQFLANIREVDAIIHVVRCFENSDIIHVAGRINPLDDIQVIEYELMLADLSTAKKALLNSQKKVKSGDKNTILLINLLEKVINNLDNQIPIRHVSWNSEEFLLLKQLCFLTAKPVLYILNHNLLSISEQHQSEYYNATKAHVNNVIHYIKENFIQLDIMFEYELTKIQDEEERLMFLQDANLSFPAINVLIEAAYKLLNLQTYFTAGEKEVRAWTIEIGANAQNAAGVIHTDFAKGFIRAEVISYDDFIKYNGEQGAKEAGKMRLEGKEYIVSNGDIMHFRFNV